MINDKWREARQLRDIPVAFSYFRVTSYFFAREMRNNWVWFYLSKTAQIRAEMCWISLHIPRFFPYHQNVLVPAFQEGGAASSPGKSSEHRGWVNSPLLPVSYALSLIICQWFLASESSSLTCCQLYLAPSCLRPWFFFCDLKIRPTSPWWGHLQAVCSEAN